MAKKEGDLRNNHGLNRKKAIQLRKLQAQNSQIQGPDNKNSTSSSK